MKKYFKILFPILFLSGLAFVGYKIVTKIQYKKQVAKNIKTIPRFEYLKINGGTFGNQNLKPNTPTIFIYFNTECEFCNEEAIVIEQNLSKFSGVQLVFVSFEKPSVITQFAKTHKLLNYDNVCFLSDSKTTFATTFDVKSLPCLMLYDKDQQLIEKIKGQTKVETLLAKISLPNPSKGGAL
jgi:peroxiredoxin